MEAHGNQLNEEFLDKVQNGPDKSRDDDLVESVFPASGTLITIDMVVFHGGQERNFHTQPPEKEGSMDFKLLGQAAPFLRIVCENAGEKAHDDGDTFRQNL